MSRRRVRTVDTLLEELRGAARESFINKWAKIIEGIISRYSIDPARIGYRRDLVEDFLLEHCSGLDEAECYGAIEDLVVKAGGRKSIEQIADEYEDYARYLEEKEKRERLAEAPRAKSLEQFREEILMFVASAARDWVERYGEALKSAFVEELKESIKQDPALLESIRRFLDDRLSPSRIILYRNFVEAAAVAEEAYNEYIRRVQAGADPEEAFAEVVEARIQPLLTDYQFIRRQVLAYLADQFRTYRNVDVRQLLERPEAYITLLEKPPAPVAPPRPPPRPPVRPAPPRPTPTPTPTPVPAVPPAPPRPPARVRQFAKRLAAQATLEQFARPEPSLPLELPVVKRVDVTVPLPLPPPRPEKIEFDLLQNIREPIFTIITRFIHTTMERTKSPGVVNNLIAFRPQGEDAYSYFLPLDALDYILGWLGYVGFDTEIRDDCLGWIGEWHPLPGAGFLGIGLVPITELDVREVVRFADTMLVEWASRATETDLEGEVKMRLIQLFYDTSYRRAARFYDIGPILSNRYRPYVRQLQLGVPGVVIGVGQWFRRATVYLCGAVDRAAAEEKLKTPPPIVYPPIQPPADFQTSASLLRGLRPELLERAPPLVKSFIDLVEQFTLPGPQRDPRPYAAALSRLAESYTIPPIQLRGVIELFGRSGFGVEVDDSCSRLIGEMHFRDFHKLFAVIGEPTLMRVAKVHRNLIWPLARLIEVARDMPGIEIDIASRVLRIHTCGEPTVKSIVQREAALFPLLPPPPPERVTITGVTIYRSAQELPPGGKAPTGSEPWARFISTSTMSVVLTLNMSGYIAVDYPRGCPTVVGDRQDIMAYIVHPAGIREVRVLRDMGSWAEVAPPRGSQVVLVDKAAKRYVIYTCV